MFKTNLGYVRTCLKCYKQKARINGRERHLPFVGQQEPGKFHLKKEQIKEEREAWRVGKSMPV